MTTPMTSKVGMKKSKVAASPARPDTLPPWRILDELSEEQLSDIERYILNNLRRKGAPNLTAAILSTFVNGLDVPCCKEEPMTIAEGRALLRHLGYSWKKLKKGYYARKSLEGRVVTHRDEYVVAMEALYSRPDLFHLICTDESGFRVNYVEQWGWCREPEDVYDLTNQTGPGQGYNMLDFMDQNGLLFRDPSLGPSLSNLVGHVLKTVAPSQKKHQGTGKKRGRPKKSVAKADQVVQESDVRDRPLKKRKSGSKGQGRAATQRRTNRALLLGSDDDFDPELELEQENQRSRKRAAGRERQQDAESEIFSDVSSDLIVEEDAAAPKKLKKAADSGKDAKEEYYKMDAKKFQSALGEAIGVIKASARGKRDAGRHVVFFGDGSSVHLVMEEGAWNPKQMNWDSSTSAKPVTLKQKLTELKIPIPAKRPKGGHVAWAHETLFATEAFAQQLTAGESIAKKNGCFFLYGPVASPYFNPKENFYRFVKSRIRKANGPSLKQLEGILDECCKDETLPSRCKKWFERAKGFRLWFSSADHVGKGVLPPTERQIDAAMRTGALDELESLMEDKIEAWLQNISTTGHVPQNPHEVDTAKLRRVLRDLNVQRYKRGFEEEDDKEEEEDK